MAIKINLPDVPATVAVALSDSVLLAYGSYGVARRLTLTRLQSLIGGGGATGGHVLSGFPIPDESVGDDGDIYIRFETGDIFYNHNGWSLYTGGSTIVGGSVGSGSPEGVVTAPTGTPYLDGDTNDFWFKKTGADNTGWVRLLGG